MTWRLLFPVPLFLLGIDVLTALVPPPTNVTLRCHNLTNILMWDYDNVTQGLQFRVDIRAYYNQEFEGFQNVIWVKPPALKADVSFLSDPAEEYSLSVTAVIGDMESEPSPSDGLSFSYFTEAFVNYKCFVELPLVNITEKPHDRIQLHFKHPWLLYREKLGTFLSPQPKKRRSHDPQPRLPTFDYSVKIVNQKEYTFQCQKAACEEEIPVDPKQEKHCVQIEGSLYQIMIKGSQEYCAQALVPPDHTYLYMLIALVVITAVAGVTIMVFYKKTNSFTHVDRPATLNISHQNQQRSAHSNDDTIANLQCEDRSSSPLIVDVEDSLVVEPIVDRPQLDEVHLPILVNEPPVLHDIQADPEEGANQRQSVGLNESGYEFRPAVSVTSDGYGQAGDLKDCSDSSFEEQ